MTETNRAIATLQKRRSQYALGRSSALSHDQIEALIKQAMRLSPSTFNSQSSRAVILFGASSEKFWRLTSDALRAIVPAADFAPTEGKMNAFAAGIGTVLFYEDQATVKGLQQKFPLYADVFPTYSEHSTGMTQISVWNALAEAGLGASLQHYSPVVDAAAAAAFNVPDSWTLRAQMPFGSHEGALAEKTFIADEGRFLTFT